MSGRVVKIVVLTLLVAGVVSYLYVLNPTSVQLTMMPGKTKELPLALVLIFTFGAGALLISLFVMIIGVKGWLYRRKEARRAELAESHKRLLVSARERAALGDYQSAAALLLKIVLKDPSDMVARIQLAEAYQKNGDLPTALKMLEEARVEQRQNVELLLLASDLNAAMGNQTAAHDNAALVLKLIPKNTFALSRLVASAASLKRYEEAAGYQRMLLKLSPGVDQSAAQSRLADLELKAALKNHTGNAEGLRKEVSDILRRHREFAPALETAAYLEEQDGRTDAATKLLCDAFQSSKNLRYLEKAAIIWLRAENPQKALSIVASALKKKDSECELIEGLLFHASLLLHLEMLDEASRELKKVRPETITDEKTSAAYEVLHCRLLRREGKLDEAFESALRALSEDSFINRTLLLGEVLEQGHDRDSETLPLADSPGSKNARNVFQLSTP
jgi:tetratricopeptide (TPR) repeat protein